MATIGSHARAMTMRHIQELIRQPWYIAIQLMQPIIWLLLFGSLFQEALSLPGSGIDDYRAYLTPGVVIMTAIFTAGWTGMSLINDIKLGVMDRWLVTPVSRHALINGRLIQLAIVVVVQSLIIVGLGALTGFSPNLSGLGLMLLSSVLIAWAIGAMSTGFALLSGDEQAMIGLNMVVLPLMLLSTAFMHPDFLPGWIATVASVNPVNWAVEASRETLSTGTEWSFVLLRVAALTALAIVGSLFAVRAFRAYQRSM